MREGGAREFGGYLKQSDDVYVYFKDENKSLWLVDEISSVVMSG